MCAHVKVMNGMNVSWIDSRHRIASAHEGTWARPFTRHLAQTLVEAPIVHDVVPGARLPGPGPGPEPRDDRGQSWSSTRQGDRVEACASDAGVMRMGTGARGGVRVAWAGASGYAPEPALNLIQGSCPDSASSSLVHHRPAGRRRGSGVVGVASGVLREGGSNRGADVGNRRCTYPRVSWVAASAVEDGMAHLPCPRRLRTLRVGHAAKSRATCTSSHNVGKVTHSRMTPTGSQRT